jgi:two-component system sensor histidine kinase/response regulator
MEKVFEEFQQVEEIRDGHLGGTGIASALVKRLIELHDGEVGLENNSGEGTTFWFTLPEARSSASSDASRTDPVQEPESRSVRGRVLVADDNEVNRVLFTDVLISAGYEVSIARNGREAVEVARSSHPDVILMDMDMPVMDGLEATRELRTMTRFEKIPIIAISGNADIESIERCMEAGCDEHVSKPVAIKKLLEPVGNRMTS